MTHCSTPSPFDHRLLDGPHRIQGAVYPLQPKPRPDSEPRVEAPRFTLHRRNCPPTGPLMKEDFLLRLRFAALVLGTKESLAEGLKHVEWDLLGFAMLGSQLDVREYLLDCLEAPMRDVVQVFMSHLSGISEREISVAQRLVLEQLLPVCEDRVLPEEPSY